MRHLLAIIFGLLAAPAVACDTYTSELWDDGVRTATFNESGLVIRDRDQVFAYPEVVSAGTGIPFRIALDKDGNGLAVRIYNDVLIVEMEIFTPYCADAN